MPGLYEAMTSGNLDGIRAAQRQLPEGYELVPGNSYDGSFVGVEVRGYDHKVHYAGDGWKFHLSVHPDDLPRATELVMQQVAKHGVQAFKVTTPQTAEDFNNPLNPQAGKQFTLYGARNKTDFRWDNVIRDIELSFTQEGIRPSVSTIQGDRMVPGSRYAGYRNELSHGMLNNYADHNGYLGAENIRYAVRDGRVAAGWEHNPTRQPDRLQNIDFSRDPEIIRARQNPQALAGQASWRSGGMRLIPAEEAAEMERRIAEFDAANPSPKLNLLRQATRGVENIFRRIGTLISPKDSLMPQEHFAGPEQFESRMNARLFSTEGIVERPIPPISQWVEREVTGSDRRVMQLDVSGWSQSKIDETVTKLQSQGVPAGSKFSNSTQKWVIQVDDPALLHKALSKISPSEPSIAVSPGSRLEHAPLVRGTSNAALCVQADLRQALGENNIIGVRRVEGGYRVEVPDTYSRSNFERLGIVDASSLERPSSLSTARTHTIIIPDSRLPESIARDARVFDALDRAGVSDIARHAHRTGHNGQVTGYVIDVPETYSRSNLAAAGIDVSRIPDTAREPIGNGLHRITIPVDATLEVAEKTPQQVALEEMRHRLGAQGRGRMMRPEPGMGERDLHAPLRPLPPQEAAPVVSTAERRAPDSVGAPMRSDAAPDPAVGHLYPQDPESIAARKANAAAYEAATTPQARLAVLEARGHDPAWQIQMPPDDGTMPLPKPNPRGPEADAKAFQKMARQHLEMQRAAVPDATGAEARGHRGAVLASHSIGIATTAVNAAAAAKALHDGDYQKAAAYGGAAVQSGAMEAALSETGMRTGLEIAEVAAEKVGWRGAMLVTKAAGTKIPVIGAAVGAAFGVAETGYEIYEATQGRSNLAKVASTAGSAIIQTGSGFFGFLGLGAGEAVQEGWRSATGAMFGQENAARHSAVVEVGQMAYDIATGKGETPPSKGQIQYLLQQLNQSGWARALGNHDGVATEAELTAYLAGPHNKNQALDANHDGKISGGELQRFMQSNGDTVDATLRREVGGLIGQMNATGWSHAVGNHDDKATVDEVMATLKAHKITMQSLDTNNDGHISGGELQRGFQAAHISKNGAGRG